MKLVIILHGNIINKMADKDEQKAETKEKRSASLDEKKMTDTTTKLTLRTIKNGDPSAWAPIAATEEVSPESQTVKSYFNYFIKV